MCRSCPFSNGFRTGEAWWAQPEALCRPREPSHSVAAHEWPTTTDDVSFEGRGLISVVSRWSSMELTQWPIAANCALSGVPLVQRRSGSISRVRSTTRPSFGSRRHLLSTRSWCVATRTSVLAKSRRLDAASAGQKSIRLSIIGMPTIRKCHGSPKSTKTAISTGSALNARPTGIPTVPMKIRRRAWRSCTRKRFRTTRAERCSPTCARPMTRYRSR